MRGCAASAGRRAKPRRQCRLHGPNASAAAPLHKPPGATCSRFAVAAWCCACVFRSWASNAALYDASADSACSFSRRVSSSCRRVVSFHLRIGECRSLAFVYLFSIRFSFTLVPQCGSAVEALASKQKALVAVRAVPVPMQSAGHDGFENGKLPHGQP